MKNIILLLFLIYLTSATARASSQDGVYSCPVSFSSGAFEVLMFDMKEQVKDPVYLFNASQTTPNFMLIKPENETKQSSVKMSKNPEDTFLESYQVHWEDTWYFGSTLTLFVTSLLENGFQAEIEFSDNDGLSEVITSTCLLEKRSDLERSATSIELL